MDSDREETVLGTVSGMHYSGELLDIKLLWMQQGI